VDDKKLYFTLTNNYGTDIIITSSTITWPIVLEKFEKIKRDGDTIFDKDIETSPSYVPADQPWKDDEEKRVIADGSSYLMMYEWKKDIAGTVSITIGFDVGCNRGISHTEGG
jgi:hypothetical protein